jgi:hypothetical protein
MEQIRRDYVLNYPIDKIKESIETVCKNNIGFKLNSRNEAFNSYSFSFIKMLSVLPVNIQLIKIDDNQTRIDLSATPGQNLSKTPNFVNGLLDTFLDLVSRVISGELVYSPRPERKQPPISKTKSNIITIVFVIVAFALLYLIFHK